jgi:hypothetical protein
MESKAAVKKNKPDKKYYYLVLKNDSKLVYKTPFPTFPQRGRSENKSFPPWGK